MFPQLHCTLFGFACTTLKCIAFKSLGRFGGSAATTAASFSVNKQVTVHHGPLSTLANPVNTCWSHNTLGVFDLAGPNSHDAFNQLLSSMQSPWVSCNTQLGDFVIGELLKCVAGVQSADVLWLPAVARANTISLFSGPSLLFAFNPLVVFSDFDRRAVQYNE